MSWVDEFEFVELPRERLTGLYLQQAWAEQVCLARWLVGSLGQQLSLVCPLLQLVLADLWHQRPSEPRTTSGKSTYVSESRTHNPNQAAHCFDHPPPLPRIPGFVSISHPPFPLDSRPRPWQVPEMYRLGWLEFSMWAMARP